MRMTEFANQKVVTVGKYLAMAVLSAVALTAPVHGAKLKPPGALELKAFSVPSVVLAAVGQGGFPSHAYITLTSNNGPFCVQGLRLDVSSTVEIFPGTVGDVTLQLSRIDGFGVSHPSIKLVDGNTGGFSPLDAVLSYGNAICASHSLQFHGVQWSPTQGDGIALMLSAQAIVSTGKFSVITAVGSTTE